MFILFFISRGYGVTLGVTRLVLLNKISGVKSMVPLSSFSPLIGCFGQILVRGDSRYLVVDFVE